MKREATFRRQFQFHDGIWSLVAGAIQAKGHLNVASAAADLAIRFPESSRSEITEALLLAASEAKLPIVQPA